YVGDIKDEEVRPSVSAARDILKAAGYENLESIPSRKRKLDAAIKDAMAAGDWDKVGRLSAEIKRAEKGLPPLPEKKPRAKKTPASTETAPKERKPRKKKDQSANDLVLHGDGKLESLTEPANVGDDGDPAWLTRHPEPK